MHDRFYCKCLSNQIPEINIIFKEVEQIAVLSAEKKIVVLVAWERVCVPKKFGGLNFKDSKSWNVA